MFTNQDDPALPAAKPAGKGGLFLWSALAIVSGLLFVYLLFFPARLGTGAGESHPAVGTHLPSLRLEPLTGEAKPVRLADLKGKVVLVNYWGTWCGPCKMEFPSLVALDREMRNENDFRFLSVSCGGNAANEVRDELESNTTAFLRSANADISTYFDQNGASRKSLIEAAKLHEFGYPATVLLDRQGVIRALWMGYDPAFEREMEEVVRKVLAEKAKT